MTNKLVALMMLVLTIALLGSLSGWLPQVQGQKEEKAAAWEYKVVVSEPQFGIVGKTDLDLFKNAADGFTKEYNKLAEEGWEFVSPLFTQPGQRGTEPARTFVVFRRPKK